MFLTPQPSNPPDQSDHVLSDWLFPTPTAPPIVTANVAAVFRVGSATIRSEKMGANGTYIWWNGELMLEERALVPVTQIGWTGVSAVFEGMVSSENECF